LIQTDRPDRALRKECKLLSDLVLWELKLDHETIYTRFFHGDRGGEIIERLKTLPVFRVEPLIENHADG
jgi:hypothetical protein